MTGTLCSGLVTGSWRGDGVSRSIVMASSNIILVREDGEVGEELYNIFFSSPIRFLYRDIE